MNVVTAPSGAYGLGPQDGVGYVVLPPAGNRPEDEMIPTDSPDADRRDRVAFPPLDGDAPVDSEVGFVTVDLTADSFTLTCWGLGTVDAPRRAWARDTVTYSR